MRLERTSEYWVLTRGRMLLIVFRYVVEQILSHIIDEEVSIYQSYSWLLEANSTVQGVIKYEVKWEGFEKKTDRTWEPEENLYCPQWHYGDPALILCYRETAPKILEEYLARIGGKEALLEAFNEKKPKGKKRGRASTTTESGVNGSKRGKKNGAHPASSTPPASAKSAEFKPPSGNWEEEVVGIDACEGNGGNIVVYLTWKSGEKSQHPLHQVYKRCPQKVNLTFSRLLSC